MKEDKTHLHQLKELKVKWDMRKNETDEKKNKLRNCKTEAAKAML